MAYAALTIDVNARLADLQSGLTKVEQMVGKTESSMARLGSAVGAVTGAFGALGVGASVAGLVAMTKAFVDSGAEITRLARLSNVTTDEFQKLSAGADLVGIGADKLADIFKDVQDKVGDFLQNGGGPLKDFFDNIAPQVGVTAEQFRKLSGPQALELYVSSLQKAGISQNEMTFYMEAIANDATLLLPLLVNNAKGFRDAGDEAARMGAILDKETLAASEKFRKEMVTLGRQLEGAKVSIFGPLIEALADVVTNFNAAQRAGLGFWNSLGTDKSNIQGQIEFYEKKLAGIRKELDAGGRDFYGRPVDTTLLERQAAEAEAQLTKLRNLQRALAEPPVAAVVTTATQQQGNQGRQGRGKDSTKETVDSLKSLIDSSLSRDFERLMKDAEALDQVVADALSREDDRLGAAAERWKDLIDPSRNYTRQLEEIRDLVASGKLTPEQGIDAELDVESRRSDDLFGGVAESAENAKSVVEELGLTFQSAFEDAVIGGEKLSDVLDAVLQDVARFALRKTITEPLMRTLFGLFPNEDGNVFDAGGHVKRFALGGVVSSPTLFPYSGGTGLMGEAGPEAIMPLKRGRDGKLGVAGGGGVVVNQSIAVGSGVSYNDVMAAMMAAKEEAKREVYESMRRGGAYA